MECVDVDDDKPDVQGQIDAVGNAENPLNIAVGHKVHRIDLRLEHVDLQKGIHHGQSKADRHLPNLPVAEIRKFQHDEHNRSRQEERMRENGIPILENQILIVIPHPRIREEDDGAKQRRQRGKVIKELFFNEHARD